MEVTRGNRIDGAVLDVNLGGNLVYPLARMLAERAVPMIFLTGYQKGIIEQEFEMFPVLQKPVPEEELTKALATILG